MSKYRVTDRKGNAFADVDGDVVYRDGIPVGYFRYIDGQRYFVGIDDEGEPQHYGYVDGNREIRDMESGEYVASVRRSSPRTFTFPLFFLFATLLSVLLAGLAVRSFKDYIPTYFIANEGEDKWEQSKNLPVFENEGNGDIGIAPGMTGSYQFRLSNENGKRLLYNLFFEEVNDSDINLQYRLRKGDEYVAGSAVSYVPIDLLNQYDGYVAEKSSTIYTLEWKWEDSPNDTLAGMSDASYTLKISFSAKITTFFPDRN